MIPHVELQCLEALCGTAQLGIVKASEAPREYLNLYGKFPQKLKLTQTFMSQDNFTCVTERTLIFLITQLTDTPRGDSRLWGIILFLFLKLEDRFDSKGVF